MAIDGLTPKQSTAAMLLALGRTQTEACEQAKIGQTALWRWLKLPVFQERVAAYRQQMFERLQGQTLEEVMADAPQTFSRLRELRDQAANLPVALGAARELFARQMPAKTQHEESRTIRIVLEKKDEAFARQVLEEERTIDITPEAPDAAPPADQTA